MTYYIIEHPSVGRWVTDGCKHRFSPIVDRSHPNVVRFSSLNQVARCLLERPWTDVTSLASHFMHVWCYYDDGADDVGWERIPSESVDEAAEEVIREVTR